MIDFQANAFHALKQMSRAIKRGDLDTALRWTLLADRQIEMARRISDLYAQRHRPKPLPRLPSPPPLPPAPRSRSRDASDPPGYQRPLP